MKKLLLSSVTALSLLAVNSYAAQDQKPKTL